MPYIGCKDRENYSQDLGSLREQSELRGLNPEEQAQVAAKLVLTLLEESYPGGDRYFRHNEVVGMLKCCSLEWQRRNNIDGYITDNDLLKKGDHPISSSKEVMKRVGKVVSELSSEVRPGVLNYFITVFFKGLFVGLPTHQKDLPVSVLESVLDHWYSERTAPYEDRKIEENGDV